MKISHIFWKSKPNLWAILKSQLQIKSWSKMIAHDPSISDITIYLSYIQKYHYDLLNRYHYLF